MKKYFIISIYLLINISLLNYINPVLAEKVNHKVLTPEDKCFIDNNLKTCIGHSLKSDINFTIDYLSKTITAKSILEFENRSKASQIFFFFDPTVNKILLDNKIVDFKISKAPQNEDNIIIIPVNHNQKKLKIEIDYQVKHLTKWSLNWEPFHLVTDYSDSSDARFINQFAPASFEMDRYPMTYNFEFKNLNQTINLFSSAYQVNKSDKNKYQLKFSDWNNVAGPYFDFTTSKYRTHQFTYKGKYKPIPVLLYLDENLGKTKNISYQSLAIQTQKVITESLKKFETTMGQYAFNNLTVKLYSLQTGDLPLKEEYSMEYSAAIVSRLELIPHEICHQWFGRGASPKDGQAGFVDELICDWYDYDNPVKSPKNRKPIVLSTNNIFTLRTPEDSYQEGVFLAEISYLYKQKGLDIYTTLSNFYKKYRLTSYSRDDFTNFLEANYKGDLKSYFQKYIYGKSLKNNVSK